MNGAEEIIWAAIGRMPKELTLRQSLVGVDIRQKQYNDAVASTKEYLASDLPTPSAWLLLASAQLQAAATDNALAALAEAEKLDPT